MKTLKQILITFLISFSAVASINVKDYIFAVVENQEGTYVYINVLDHWEKEGSLIDSYRTEEEDEFINNEMNSLDLCNSMESTFEPCSKTYSKNEYIKALKSRGFTHNIQFEKWITNETK
jgi:hypothetical protein